MTGRIDTTFANAKKAGRGTLGVFITAGDPDAATTSALLDALVGLASISLNLACHFLIQWPMAQRYKRRHCAP